MMLQAFQLDTNKHLLDVQSVKLFSAEQCAAIIDSLDQAWNSARIAGSAQDGRGEVATDVRSVVSQNLLPDGAGFPIGELYAALRGINDASYRFDLRGVLESDGPSVLRYEADTNDHYRPHRDYGEQHAFRKLSAIVQLSPPENYLGGDLVFQEVGQIASREQGTLTVFPSFLSHTVTPVVRGVRHCIVMWVHGPSLR